MSTHLRASRKGQGALEYLLLIGGSVLVATIILLFALAGYFPASNQILQNNITTYNTKITQGIFGGGGSGGGSSCGNGTVDAGEACDDSATPNYPAPYQSGLCVAYNPALYSGGNLSCTGCSLGTSACTPIAPDTSPPAFNFFTANAPNSIGGTVKVDLGWAASDATPPIQYAGANPGLAMEENGSTILTGQMNTTANFNSQVFNPSINYLSPNNNSISFNHLDNTLDDDGLMVGQPSCYNMMYCDSVSPPNCEVQPVGGIACRIPWQAYLEEAENYASAGIDVLTGPYTDGSGELQTVIYDDPIDCAPGSNIAYFTNMVNLSDHLPGTAYKVWIRAASDETLVYNTVSRVQGAAVAFSIPVPGPTSNFTWIPATATSTQVPDGVQSITVQPSCGNSVGGASTYVDKILYTTDLSCLPSGDGSNCA